MLSKEAPSQGVQRDTGGHADILERVSRLWGSMRGAAGWAGEGRGLDTSVAGSRVSEGPSTGKAVGVGAGSGQVTKAGDFGADSREESFAGFM